MPGLNQTGPMGQGSMTGRKMGKCTNFGAKNQQSTTENVPANGRGMGRGLGRGQGGQGMGMGRRNRFGNGSGNGINN